MDLKSLLNGLNVDERELVTELTQQEGWRPFLKVIENLVKKQEYKVLSYDVAQGAERLVQEKCRAEGARQLSSDIAQFKQLLNKSLR